MKELTDKQKEEFWERCGLLCEQSVSGAVFVHTKDMYYEISEFPVDLNNLFKYAVPVVIEKIMAGQECSSDLAYAILFKKWLQELQLDIPHADTALFKVCYKALGDKK